MGGIASMLTRGRRAVSCHPIEAGDGVATDRDGLAPGDGAVPRNQRPGLAGVTGLAPVRRLAVPVLLSVRFRADGPSGRPGLALLTFACAAERNRKPA